MLTSDNGAVFAIRPTICEAVLAACSSERLVMTAAGLSSRLLYGESGASSAAVGVLVVDHGRRSLLLSAGWTVVREELQVPCIFMNRTLTACRRTSHRLQYISAEKHWGTAWLTVALSWKKLELLGASQRRLPPISGDRRAHNGSRFETGHSLVDRIIRWLGQHPTTGLQGLQDKKRASQHTCTNPLSQAHAAWVHQLQAMTCQEVQAGFVTWSAESRADGLRGLCGALRLLQGGIRSFNLLHPVLGRPLGPLVFAVSAATALCATS